MITRNTGGDSRDYVGEMTRRNRSDDRAADALFSGRVPPGHEDLAFVASLASALRSTASKAPEPHPGLAAVLSEGLSTDKGDLPVMAGSNVHAHEAPGLPKWRRSKKMLEIALAKLTTLGLAAKVGIASAAVVAGATGAGAAGVLPAPAQDAVAASIEAVTPFDLPDSVDDAVSLVAEDPAENDHGQNVSDVATSSEAEGCERGHEIATAAGGEPGDCEEEVEEEPVVEDEGSRPENPGAEGRTTADTNAGDNGQEGRDTADDAATNGSDFGETKATEGRENADREAPEGEEEPVVTERQPEESQEAGSRDTGEEKSSTAREESEEAGSGSRETGDDAAGDNRP